MCHEMGKVGNRRSRQCTTVDATRQVSGRQGDWEGGEESEGDYKGREKPSGV